MDDLSTLIQQAGNGATDINTFMEQQTTLSMSKWIQTFRDGAYQDLDALKIIIIHRENPVVTKFLDELLQKDDVLSVEILKWLIVAFRFSRDTVPMDLPKTLECYRKLALKGDLQAMETLAWAYCLEYLEDQYIEKDDAEAVKWAMLAVDTQGQTTILGTLYHHFKCRAAGLQLAKLLTYGHPYVQQNFPEARRLLAEIISNAALEPSANTTLTEATDLLSKIQHAEIPILVAPAPPTL